MDGFGEFHTLKGHEISEETELTAAMEDYLEMICRLSGEEEPVRLGSLAKALHVKPSSASKMILLLKEEGYLKGKKYASLSLTEKGERVGRYLLYRHQVVVRFLCLLNHTQDELEQAERIEHYFNQATIENLAELVNRLEKENPGPSC